MLLTLSRIGAANRVVAYTVHEPANSSSDPVERAEALVFVRDGMNWMAFFFAPIWLLVNLMWIPLLGYIAATALVGAVLELIGLNPAWTTMAILGINLIVALEADSMRRWVLQRKGWKMIGTVSGANTRECERRFFEHWVDEVEVGSQPAPLITEGAIPQ
ncbi:MAG: DUF2628 domain-containing protein [Alphaproteobacteria bacterium]|nr:DUF2628 domain-containing protein [Alphaproteobacteria bacterium]